MDITLNNVDSTKAKITLKVTSADYQEKVEKKLKDARKQAQMPGFRKGKVPANLIKKMYGQDFKGKEINEIISKSLQDFIQKENVKVLGEPIFDEKQSAIDLAQDDFEFTFDVALSPEFDVKLTGNDKLDIYNIEISEETIKNSIEEYTQRYGEQKKVDSYEDKDLMKGTLTELTAEGEVKEGGLVVEEAILSPSFMVNEDQKKIFEGCALNTSITFNPTVAYEGRNADIASLLKIGKEEIENHNTNFNFQVNEILRFTPAEVNQDLFDKAFGEGNVKTEEEFKEKIKEQVAQRHETEIDFKFLQDAREHMMKKVGKLEFAEDLLKRIMKDNNPDKDDAYIAENFDKSLEELKWQLIKDQLLNSLEVKVEEEDIKTAAREFTKIQFMQYGLLGQVTDEMLEMSAQNMLQNKEQRSNLIQRAIDIKLTAAMKEKAKLNEISISEEDFRKLFE